MVAVESTEKHTGFLATKKVSAQGHSGDTGFVLRLLKMPTRAEGDVGGLPFRLGGAELIARGRHQAVFEATGSSGADPVRVTWTRPPVSSSEWFTVSFWWGTTTGSFEFCFRRDGTAQSSEGRLTGDRTIRGVASSVEAGVIYVAVRKQLTTTRPIPDHV